MTTLSELYKTCSTYKWRAYLSICNQCEKDDGYNLRVINGNCHFFTMGYFYNDKKTGVMHCKYFTANNTYDSICEAIQ